MPLNNTCRLKAKEWLTVIHPALFKRRAGNRDYAYGKDCTEVKREFHCGGVYVSGQNQAPLWIYKATHWDVGRPEYEAQTSAFGISKAHGREGD
jgi:hypothetical protein